MNVLYPGSFDPLTIGHMNIIEQASQLFDTVVVAILVNPNKKDYLLTKEERYEVIQKIYQDNAKVKVISSNKPTVDVALENDCHAIIRGLRNITDFDYEYQAATINKELSLNQVKTICLFTEPLYQHISSSMVKQIINLDKPIDKYVDPLVKKKILMKGAR